MREFPQKQFILVGDSGEHDADIYAEVYSRPGNAERIEQILIRMVPNNKRSEQEYHDIFAAKNVPRDKYQLFSAPSHIEDW